LDAPNYNNVIRFNTDISYTAIHATLLARRGKKKRIERVYILGMAKLIEVRITGGICNCEH
jgi:nicotinamidase-related amidase